MKLRRRFFVMIALVVMVTAYSVSCKPETTPLTSTPALPITKFVAVPPATSTPETTPIVEGIPDSNGLLGIDGSDNIHYIWSEMGGPEGQGKRVMYSVKRAQGEWTEPETIFETTKENSRSSLQIEVEDIFIDHNDTVHIIWSLPDETERRIFDLFYAAKVPGKDWSIPMYISNGCPYNSASIHVDSKGTLHLVCLEADVPGIERNAGVVYLIKLRENEWTEPVIVPGTEDIPSSTTITLIRDNKDEMLLAYYFKYGIYVSEKKLNSVWTLPRSISEPTGWSMPLDVVVDHDDVVHMAMKQQDTHRIGYYLRDKDGSWSFERFLSDTYQLSNTAMLAVGKNNTVYFAWTQQQNPTGRASSREPSSLLVAWRGNDGLWSSPYLLYTTLEDEWYGHSLWVKSLLVDGAGAIHVLVQERGGESMMINRYINFVPTSE